MKKENSKQMLFEMMEKINTYYHRPNPVQFKQSNEINEENENNNLQFIKGNGYWDLTKHPYGGDFKRFQGNETGHLVKGSVKKGDEIRVELDDGRIIVASANSVENIDFDELIDMADANGRTIS